MISIARVTSTDERNTINMVALRILTEIKSGINAACLITNINMANTIMDLKYGILRHTHSLFDCFLICYKLKLPMLVL